MGTSLRGMVTMFMEITLESKTLTGFNVLSNDFKHPENINTLLAFLFDKEKRQRTAVSFNSGCSTFYQIPYVRQSVLHVIQPCQYC